jgi:beta-glucanase (GH16 family)
MQSPANSHDQNERSLKHFGHAISKAFLGITCATTHVALLKTASAQIPDVPGWELTWHDEFDGTTLNTTNWAPLNRQNSVNEEKQYYRPEQVTVANGTLRLTATNQPLGSKQYRSGLITSKALYGPGRFEARIDLPTTQGMWPAFWLNANQVPWPQGGEIDIMENRGSQPTLVSSAFHWQKNPGPCCNNWHYVFQNYSASSGGEGVNFTAGFHTYAAEWDTTQIGFYVDGNLYHTVKNNSHMPDDNFPMSDANFTTAKNIILNLAVGGNFGGDPDGSTVFPQTMEVDYVRVWQRLAGLLPGDYNNDQRVDAADYVVWRRGLGTTYTQADYDVWRANFGQTIGSGGALPSAEPLPIAVPEPTTLTLLIMAMVVYCARRRSIMSYKSSDP